MRCRRRRAFHSMFFNRVSHQVSVEVIEDSDGQWEVVPAPKPLAQNPNSIGGPQHMESRARATGPDDAAAKFGFSRPAQVSRPQRSISTRQDVGPTPASIHIAETFFFAHSRYFCIYLFVCLTTCTDA